MEGSKHRGRASCLVRKHVSHGLVLERGGRAGLGRHAEFKLGRRRVEPPNAGLGPRQHCDQVLGWVALDHDAVDCTLVSGRACSLEVPHEVADLEFSHLRCPGQYSEGLSDAGEFGKGKMHELFGHGALLMG